MNEERAEALPLRRKGTDPVNPSPPGSRLSTLRGGNLFATRYHPESEDSRMKTLIGESEPVWNRTLTLLPNLLRLVDAPTTAKRSAARNFLTRLFMEQSRGVCPV